MRSSLGLLFCALFCLSCARREEPALRSLVLVPIENLTADAGDPGAEALRTAVWRAFESQPALSVTLLSHRREAAGLAGALVLTGYVSPDGFHLELDGKPFACRGTLAACAQPLVGQLAAALQLEPRPLPRLEALVALARARSAPLEQTAPLLEQATAADPLFAPAWLARASHAFSRGGAQAATAMLAQAPAARMAPDDAARIRLQLAELGADPSARAAALLQLAPLVPADMQLQMQAGTAAAGSRNFDAAIETFRRALALAPNPALRNELAYALALKKDQAGATEAIGALLATAPNDPRYLDTAGDIAFFFRGYSQASAYYARAAQADAAFLGGSPLYKSALAFHLAGDAAKSSAAFAAYLELRAKSGDAASQPVAEAIWLYRTGRKPRALEILERQSSPKAALFRGLAALAARDFAAADSFARTLNPADPAFHILAALSRNAPPPPGFPIPAPALSAVYQHLHGDSAAAQRTLASFRLRMHPYQEGAWPLLAGESNVFPAAPDDWLAFLLA